jgi:hypothetical protein
MTVESYCDLADTHDDMISTSALGVLEFSLCCFVVETSRVLRQSVWLMWVYADFWYHIKPEHEYAFCRQNILLLMLSRGSTVVQET